MLYKATLTFFILFILLAGLFFPVAPTRMATTMIARNLRQTSAIISHRRIGAGGSSSRPAPGAYVPCCPGISR
ncbi:hypothetical protein K7X08_027379 [Anisodus acutangulus]|uniref:Uncharacterized protein n=1 Tax=Anisodus acutangulus TaxID=402998 RepID=A0A9Q1MMQ2_9SOLA|nr:hypothetical protein K7X08_027379 [Anisodus acutangulus]